MANTIFLHDGKHRERHAIIAVPRGSSVPINTDAPSFLTTLPAELRIEVYQWLFQRDDPIIFTGRLPDWEDDSCEPSCSVSNNEEAHLPWKPSVEIMHQPTHDIGPGIPLLHTCRQIYNEAVGILYSSNSFTISANLYRHNSHMAQFKIAAQFIRNLGSQSSLLRRLDIDIDPLCPYGHIDILPIVRILWSDSMRNCELAIIKTGRRLDPRLHHSDLSQTPGSLDACRLEYIVKAIGTEDVLDIARFGRFERLLDDMWIRRNLTFGLVGHRGLSARRGAYSLSEDGRFNSFFIREREEGGTAITPFRKRYHCVLDSLDRADLERILELVMIVKHDIVFDLDQRKAHGLDFKLLHSNARMRDYVQQHHGSFNQVVLRMSTSESKTDFSGWSSLDHWCQESISELYPRYDKCAVAAGIIALIFTSSTNVAHSELRINIRDFIRLTYGLNSLSTVRFVVAYEANGIKQDLERNTLLQDLRKRCFLLLSLALDRHPNRTASATQAPEIWIDGEGNVIEAVFPAFGTDYKETITNPHTSLSMEEQLKLGLHYASSLDVRMRPNRPEDSPFDADTRFPFGQDKILNAYGSFRSMWEALRDLEWPDPMEES